MCKRRSLRTIFASLSILTLGCLDSPGPGEPAPELSTRFVAARPHQLPFSLGGRGFLQGDSIHVTEFWGDRPALEIGGSYLVRGTWTLGSIEAAHLSVYLTNGQVDGVNTQRVEHGSGRFELSFRVLQPGHPHVSFYPLNPPHEGIGGVYFGEGEHLLRSASWYERFDGASFGSSRR